jgi:hypothetical protein
MTRFHLVRIASFLLALTALAALGAASGCGGGKPAKTGSVSGKVSYKNAPVTGGKLKFYKDNNLVYPSPIKPDGTFYCADVPPGNLKVVIETESIKNMMKDFKAGKYPEMDPSEVPIYRQIPTKYNSPATTPLTVELKVGQDITKEFELKD